MDLPHALDYVLRLLALAVSWPVAVLIVAYWFRESIKKLIDGIEFAKTPWGEVKMNRTQNAQVATGTVDDPLRPEVAGSTNPPSAPTPVTPLMIDVIKRIREAPEIAVLKGEQREEFMAQAFADKLIALSHERNYRMIFGSQIDALARANIAGGTTIEQLRALFDQYKAALPDIHGKRTFEDWYGFMTNAGLLGPVGNTQVIRPTPAGTDFLHYILTHGLPYQKAG